MLITRLHKAIIQSLPGDVPSFARLPSHLTHDGPNVFYNFGERGGLLTPSIKVVRSPLGPQSFRESTSAPVGSILGQFLFTLNPVGLVLYVCLWSICSLFCFVFNPFLTPCCNLWHKHFTVLQNTCDN